MNKNKISYNKYVAEIIGTLILVLVVALSGPGLTSIIFVGLTFAFIVYVFGEISGAHINPAFTIAALTMKKIKWQDAVLYICAQLIGAGIALIILKNMGVELKNIASAEGFSASKIFVSEIIGASVFALAFSAVIHGKTNRSNGGLTMGIGLFLGLLFANIAGGVGILNPAVAIGTNGIHWATILGSIIGVLIGAWVYRFAVHGNFCGCSNSICDKSCGCGFCHKKSNNDSSSSAPAIETVIVVDSFDSRN